MPVAVSPSEYELAAAPNHLVTTALLTARRVSVSPISRIAPMPNDCRSTPSIDGCRPSTACRRRTVRIPQSPPSERSKAARSIDYRKRAPPRHTRRPNRRRKNHHRGLSAITTACPLASIRDSRSRAGIEVASHCSSQRLTPVHPLLRAQRQLQPLAIARPLQRPIQMAPRHSPPARGQSVKSVLGRRLGSLVLHQNLEVARASTAACQQRARKTHVFAASAS